MILFKILVTQEIIPHPDRSYIVLEFELLPNIINAVVLSAILCDNNNYGTST